MRHCKLCSSVMTQRPDEPKGNWKTRKYCNRVCMWEGIRQQNIKHGKTGTPEYRSWAHMRERCFNPSDARYSRYGGRGITVCEEWKNSFEKFLETMGPRPGPGYTIDRIDNDGDYEPGNVRWATAQTQNLNRSSNWIVEFQGRRQALAEWASELGYPYYVLQKRLTVGWTVERALTKPIRKVKGGWKHRIDRVGIGRPKRAS